MKTHVMAAWEHAAKSMLGDDWRNHDPHQLANMKRAYMFGCKGMHFLMLGASKNEDRGFQAVMLHFSAVINDDTKVLEF